MHGFAHSAPRRPLVRGAAVAFKRVMMEMLTGYEISPASSGKVLDAIAVLRSQTSTADDRACAEQYLCGMVDADTALFFAHRRKLWWRL